MKNKMSRRKMALNHRVFKRWVTDLLWLVREAKMKGDGKKYIFLSTGVPP